MYKHLKTNTIYILNDRTYKIRGTSYYIEKECVETYLYHPFLKKLFRLQFFIVRMKKQGFKACTHGTYFSGFEDNHEVYLEDMVEHYEQQMEHNYNYHIEHSDLTSEIKKYKLKDKKIGFYKKVFYKNKEYPLAYAALFDGEPKGLEINMASNSINKQNYKSYISRLKGYLEEFKEEGYHDDGDDYHALMFWSRLSDFFYCWFSPEEKELDEKLYFFERALSDLRGLKKNLIYENAKDIITSLTNDTDILKGIICRHCWARLKQGSKNPSATKERCSLEVDGRDCAKKAADKRNKHPLNCS